MVKLIKHLIIRSYTRDYYTKKLDELETIYLKNSVHNEFKSLWKYMISLIFLKFYTFIIDIFINSFLILGMVIVMLFFMFLTLLLWEALNDFTVYY